jgi:predicted nucleic acid-binding protein
MRSTRSARRGKFDREACRYERLGVDARRRGELRARFDEQVVAGEIATCAIVNLELLYSARNAEEFAALRSELDTLPQCVLADAGWGRASDVYGQLAELGGAASAVSAPPRSADRRGGRVGQPDRPALRRGLRAHRRTYRAAGRLAGAAWIARSPLARNARYSSQLAPARDGWGPACAGPHTMRRIGARAV